MTRATLRSSALVSATLVLACALFASGCVQQKRFRFVPAVTACFPETATAAAQADHPSDQRPSLDCRHTQYKMAFIEFDQDGKMYDPAQEAAARKLLEREKARTKDGKVITVVYIHGWKNNASEAAPGAKPKDVEKFQGALFELGHRSWQAAGGVDKNAVPVVGIYIAWRGKTLMGPNWFTFASMWSRRNTANNIGDGPDLRTVLNRIIELTNAGNDNSRVLLIGHSFGARVLEHAIESDQVQLYDTVRPGAVARPRVDLVLYVNSANDSRLATRRVQAFRDAGLRVRHPDFKPGECDGTTPPDPKAPIAPETLAARCRPYPLVVAITSKGDSATKYLLPIANTINGDSLIDDLKKKIPPLPTANTFADQSPSEGKVRKVAAGHFEFLHSHVAREITCPRVPSPSPRVEKPVEELIDDAVRVAVADALGKPEDVAERKKSEAAEVSRRRAEDRARFERAMHPVCSVDDEDCRFVFRTLGDKPACYQVDRRRGVDEKPPFNDTPFWIMNVEPTVIKDHGDVWNVSFVEMLGQLMAPRRFFEPNAPRVQLMADAPAR